MEFLETEAATILQFFAGLRGTLSVTFEERTWSVFRQLGVLPFLTLQSSSSVGIASSTSQWETETPAIGIFKLSGTSRTAIEPCTLFTMQFRKTILIPHFNKPASRARS